MATKQFDTTIESSLPVVQISGLNTKKAANFESTLAVDGAVTFASTLSSGAQTITGANAATGVVTGVSGTAATAGGVKAFGLGSGTVGIAWGSGAPTLSAGQGSLYLRTDGSSSSTRLYVNSDGGTTWVAVTTAS